MSLADTICFSVVTALLFAGCGNGWLGEPATLDDNIVNWTQGNAGYTLTARAGSPGQVFATAAVEPSGHFVLTLPDSSVMSPLLGPYGGPPTGSNCNGNVMVNPLDSKQAMLSMAVSDGTSTSQSVARIGDHAKNSYVTADYYYFDQETTATGSITCTTDYFFFSTTDTTDYNLHFKPGWNIVANETDVAPPPGGADWRTP
jgi:hypothetical protein